MAEWICPPEELAQWLWEVADTHQHRRLRLDVGPAHTILVVDCDDGMLVGERAVMGS